MATTFSKISSEQLLKSFIQLDELQWEVGAKSSLGIAKDTTTPENYSSWLKSYDVTLRMFKDLSKQNIQSDAETQKRMEHFKKKLSIVEGSLFSLTITNTLFKQYLPPNYFYILDNPQYLHKDTAKDTAEPSPTPAVSPASPTEQPAPAPSSSSPRFVPPPLNFSLGTKTATLSPGTPSGSTTAQPAQAPSFFVPPPLNFPSLGTTPATRSPGVPSGSTTAVSSSPPRFVPPPASAAGTNLNTNRPRTQSPLNFSMQNLPSLSSPLSTTTLQPLSQRQVQPLTPPPFPLMMIPSLGSATVPSPMSVSTSSSSSSSIFYPSLVTPPSLLPASQLLNSQTGPGTVPAPTLSSSSSSTTALENQPISQRLSVISSLLRFDEETEALKLIGELPEYQKAKIYNSLWVLRGKPMLGNPIHHDNFGEVSFFNLDDRCKSTPIQKACAIEIFKIQSEITSTIEDTLDKMATLLGKRDTVEYQQMFLQLPLEIQNAIQRTHWEVCGRPMPGNPIAHDNFGRVSFLAEEQRCDVPNEKRIDTLKAVRISLFSELLKETYDIGAGIPAKVQEWEKIDKDRNIKGAEKNIAKKCTLHALAKKIVPLFRPEEAAAPTVSTDSFEALGAAYVEKYPFLKWYFLLMIPHLRLKNDL
jgi:hypothetical protein